MPKSDRPEFADTAETRLTLRRIFIEFYLEDNDFCTELIGLVDGFNGPVTDGNLSWLSVKQQIWHAGFSVERGAGSASHKRLNFFFAGKPSEYKSAALICNTRESTAY